MNEIVIDISKLTPEVQETLRDQAIKEKKPLKVLFAEIIRSTAETILATANEEDAA